MLSIFRGGGVSQVVVGGIAFSIILVFALEFRAGRNGPTASLKKECAFELKDSCVDPKDYYASFGLIVPRGVDPKAARQLGLHKKVLEGLIERELLVADAERLGISVSENEVENELYSGRAHVSLPVEDGDKLSYQLGLCRRSDERPGCEPGAETMLRELHVKRTAEEPFDYAVYEREVRILANRGPKEFKEMQQRELVAARMRALIREPVRVSDVEAFAIYQQQRTTAVVRSVALQRDWFAKYVADLSDAAVDKWATENKTQVDSAWESEKANFNPGCVPAREILFEVGPGANDDDRAELRKKIDSARERVSKGEAFGAVAREVSEGQTAVNGGELGCIGASYGVGNEELAKAAAALKPKELSQLIETPRGFHLLEVEPKLDATNLENFGRRFVARKLYVRFVADEKVKAFGEGLIKRGQAGAKLEDAVDAELAVTLPAAPKSAADKASAVPALAASDRPKVEISSPFSISGNPVPQVTPKEPLAARAFELKNPGDLYQTPIATSDGSVVIQLKEKNLAQRAEFDKNKDAIVGPLTEAKASDALARYVADLRRKAGDKLKIDQRYAEEQKQAGRDDDE
jgi:peptidyl-prolyl cis-trans isomerase D